MSEGRIPIDQSDLWTLLPDSGLVVICGPDDAAKGALEAALTEVRENAFIRMINQKSESDVTSWFRTEGGDKDPKLFFIADVEGGQAIEACVYAAAAGKTVVVRLRGSQAIGYALRDMMAAEGSIMSRYPGMTLRSLLLESLHAIADPRLVKTPDGGPVMCISYLRLDARMRDLYRNAEHDEWPRLTEALLSGGAEGTRSLSAHADALLSLGRITREMREILRLVGAP